MIVNHIDLKNYRNYSFLEMDFDEGTNIIFGDNAQGKTNILEALYVSATTKSHRSNKDKELIQFGSEEAHIRTFVEKNGSTYKIDMHLKNNKPKGVAINGIPIRKATELLGIVNIVLFSPEDLTLIKEGPSQRRRFIDMELSQLDKMYLSNLINYNKCLAQRNKLLKEISFKGKGDIADTLDVWDMQLVKYGSVIIEKRNKLIDELNEIIVDIHSKISGGKEIIKLIYEPCTTIEYYEENLFSARERDLKLKATSVGPHKDDICIMLNDIDARRFGSQGQQRTSALSLKLSEIELIKRKTDDMPILLLDDVLSELDSNRQNYLLDSIKGIQTIVTCTGLDDFIKNRFKINKVYHVVNGTVDVPDSN